MVKAAFTIDHSMECLMCKSSLILVSGMFGAPVVRVRCAAKRYGLHDMVNNNKSRTRAGVPTQAEGKARAGRWNTQWEEGDTVRGEKYKEIAVRTTGTRQAREEDTS